MIPGDALSRSPKRRRSVVKLGRELGVVRGTGERRAGRVRPVAGQRQSGRDVGQGRPPVLHLVGDPLLLDAPLPGREIAVLDLQRFQPGTDVEGGELLHQDAHRDRVGGHVVGGDEDDVGPIGQSKQADPQPQVLPGVEGRLDLGLPAVAHAGPLLVGGQVRQVHDRNRHRRGRVHDLRRGSVGLKLHSGSKPLVSLDHLGEDPAEQLVVQLALDPEGARDVVGGLDLGQRPLPLLLDRQRRGSGAVAAGDPGARPPATGRRQLREALLQQGPLARRQGRDALVQVSHGSSHPGVFAEYSLQPFSPAVSSAVVPPKPSRARSR